MGKFVLATSTALILGLLLGGCAPAAVPAPAAPAPSPKATLSPSEPTLPVGPTLAPPSQATAKPRYGGVLYRVSEVDPLSFDPHQETGRVVVLGGAAGPIFNGIVQLDPMDQDKIIGDLADRWDTSPDGKVYTFYFHKGVRWHDGTPFTADDAKFTLDRIRKPPKGMVSPREAVFQIVEDVAAVDGNTLNVTLKYPSGSFLQVLATGFNAVVPRHVVEPLGGKKISSREAIGTGPFALKAYIGAVSVEWAKNKDYFVAGRPYLDGMTAFIIPDGAAQHAAFKSGKVQMSYLGGTSTLPSDVTAIKRIRPEVVVQKTLTLNHLNLGMNTKRKPFDDPRVRKAIFLAIDRQAANQVIQQGEGYIGGSFPPTSYWALSQDELIHMPGYRQPKNNDIAEAKRLLAEAGYPDGFKTVITARPDKINQDMAVFAADQVRKVGIDMTIKTMELGAYTAAMNARNFDTYEWALGISLDDPDAVFSEFYISTGARNYEQHAIPGLDDLFAKQTRELDPAKRKEIVLRMQRMLSENPAKVIALWPSLFVLFAPEVKDYKLSDRGVQNNAKFQDVWLAK